MFACTGAVWQTFLSQATIYVDASTLGSTNLALVFALDLSDSTSCNNATKQFTVTLTSSLDSSQYWRPVMLMMAPFLVFVCIVLAVMYFERYRKSGLAEYVDMSSIRTATASTS